MSRPVVELSRWRSASESSHQGPMISVAAKAAMGRAWPRSAASCPERRARGSSRAAPRAVRAKTTTGAGTPSFTATLIRR
jgi:hypothetical protein